MRKTVRPTLIPDNVVVDVKKDVHECVVETEKVIDKVIDVAVPVINFVAEDVIPMIEKIADTMAEPDDIPIVSKQSLRINTPVETIESEHNNDCEINTVDLPIVMAHEDCLFCISPKCNRPITHIISSNIILSEPLDGIFSEIVFSPDTPHSFSLFVKNTRNDDVTLKLCYNVMF